MNANHDHRPQIAFLRTNILLKVWGWHDDAVKVTMPKCIKSLGVGMMMWWTCSHVENPMQNGRWTCQHVANPIQKLQLHAIAHNNNNYYYCYYYYCYSSYHCYSSYYYYYCYYFYCYYCYYTFYCYPSPFLFLLCSSSFFFLLFPPFLFLSLLLYLLLASYPYCASSSRRLLHFNACILLWGEALRPVALPPIPPPAFLYLNPSYISWVWQVAIFAK